MESFSKKIGITIIARKNECNQRRKVDFSLAIKISIGIIRKASDTLKIIIFGLTRERRNDAFRKIETHSN